MRPHRFSCGRLLSERAGGSRGTPGSGLGQEALGETEKSVGANSRDVQPGETVPPSFVTSVAGRAYEHSV